RRRKFFEVVPFLPQFVFGEKQQTAKRGREQTGVHFEAGNFANRFPISRQLRTITRAKNLCFAWREVVRFPVKQETSARLAIDHERINQSFQDAAIVSAPAKRKLMVKLRFVAGEEVRDLLVAE